MFTFLKKLFVSPPTENEAVGWGRRVQSNPAPPAPAYRPRAAMPPAFHPSPPPKAHTNGLGMEPVQSNGNSQGVILLLASVIKGLPLELRGRVRQSDVGHAEISIPLDKVLAQLSHGSVKITFGELRQAAPSVFTPPPS